MRSPLLQASRSCGACHLSGERELLARVDAIPVSYTHLRAHETVLDLVCRLLLEKKKSNQLKYPT